MARKKKEKKVEHFQIVDGKILMEEKDIANLSDTENAKIAFYVKTLGYEVYFVEPEPKKKRSFTVAKAEKYLAENDKAGLKKFREFKKDADKVTTEYKALKQAEKKGGKDKPDEAAVKAAQKAMVTAQREAFLAQKEWFKDKYGIEEYDVVRNDY